MNYIKDVSLRLNNEIYNMIVEIPKGTNKKFELVEPNFDKVECVRKVKGKYPFYYGCFPQTYAGDKDPLDAILLTNKTLHSLDIERVVPIAVIKTIDNNEIDDKVICVSYDEVVYIDLDKLLKPVYKFLKSYKGRHPNMYIDEIPYDKSVARTLIENANKNYFVLNLLENNIKSF